MTANPSLPEKLAQRNLRVGEGRFLKNHLILTEASAWEVPYNAMVAETLHAPSHSVGALPTSWASHKEQGCEPLVQHPDAFAAQISAAVALSADGCQTLSSEARVAHYRVEREALNTIDKYVKTSRVQLDIGHTTWPADIDRKHIHRVELHVSENGRGFDSTAARSGHDGRSIVRERASAAGADLSVNIQSD